MPSVTVRCQTDGSACPPGHTRMRIVVGFDPVTCARIAVSAVPLKREACTCTTCRKPYLGAVFGARWLTAGDGVHVQATTRDGLVGTVSVRSMSVVL